MSEYIIINDIIILFRSFGFLSELLFNIKNNYDLFESENPV